MFFHFLKYLCTITRTLKEALTAKNEQFLALFLEKSPIAVRIVVSRAVEYSAEHLKNFC